jgi:hypothetical protein
MHVNPMTEALLRLMPVWCYRMPAVSPYFAKVSIVEFIREMGGDGVALVTQELFINIMQSLVVR